MEKFISENWQWLLGALGTLFLGVLAVIRWLYKTLIKDRIDQNSVLIKEQSQNYNTKFDETHKKIDVVDTRVLIVQEDTAEIKGSLNTILTLMEKR